MPRAFVKCVRGGGKVRTVKPSSDTYIKVCYKNGHATHGEVKHVRVARGVVKK